MKLVKIISAIVCGLVAITLCIAVGIYWSKLGCSFWSLIAECVFYTMGCVGAYICIVQFIERTFFWLDKDNVHYKNTK